MYLTFDAVATAANAWGYAEHSFNNCLTLDAVDIVAGSGLVAAGQVRPPTLTHNTCTSRTVLHIVQLTQEVG